VDNKWFIDSGLSVNDKLLVEGQNKVRPGSTVNPIQVEMDSTGTMITVADKQVQTPSLAGGL
ncbi:MAG: efflux transporter periplasmic adaptor subunit, partial [Paraglaciecola sp.]